MAEKPPGAGAAAANGATSGARSSVDVSTDNSPGVATPTALEKADSQVAKKDATATDPYAHLSEREAEVLKRQVDTPTVPAGIKALYRYASRNDLLIMGVAALCAIASGAALPLMTVIFGNLQGTFQRYFFPVPGLSVMSYDDFVGEMTHLVLYFIYLAIGEFVRIVSSRPDRPLIA